MEEKTLKYLNQKAWYRLLKVIYVLSFLIIFFIGVVGIYSINEGFKVIDENKTQIVCLLGNKKTYKLRDLNISFYVSDFKNNFEYKDYFKQTEYSYTKQANIAEIMKACSTKEIEYTPDKIYTIQKITEINHMTHLSDEEKLKLASDYYDKINNEVFDSEKIKFLDFSQEIFRVETHFTYQPVSLYYLLFLLSFVVVFELIRRVFYYVVLGTFKPKR